MKKSVKLKTSILRPRSHLLELAGKLPKFQAETRHRFGSLEEILAATKRSKPVAETLKRTTRLSPHQLEIYMEREFLEIRPVNSRIKEINAGTNQGR